MKTCKNMRKYRRYDSIFQIYTTLFRYILPCLSCFQQLRLQFFETSSVQIAVMPVCLTFAEK
jgi:hypothetical protein